MSTTGITLTGHDWRNIDTKIADYLIPPMVGLKAFEQTKIPPGKMVHEFYEYEQMKAPLFTYSLEEQNAVKLKRKLGVQRMIGIRIDMEMPKVELDSMRANGLSYEADSLRLGALNMQQMVDRAIFLGTSARGARGSKSIAVEGIYNKTGVQTVLGGIGKDGNVTAAGDLVDTVVRMKNELVKENHYGPYKLFMSPGIASQSTKNRNTTSDRTDLSLIYDIPSLTDGGEIAKQSCIQGVYVTKELNSVETETNSLGQMMLVDTTHGKENIELLVNYEIQRLNLWGGGLNEKLAYQFVMIAGLAANVRRPKCICKCSDLTLDVFA